MRSLDRGALAGFPGSPLAGALPCAAPPPGLSPLVCAPTPSAAAGVAGGAPTPPASARAVRSAGTLAPDLRASNTARSALRLCSSTCQRTCLSCSSPSVRSGSASLCLRNADVPRLRSCPTEVASISTVDPSRSAVSHDRTRIRPATIKGSPRFTELETLSASPRQQVTVTKLWSASYQPLPRSHRRTVDIKRKLTTLVPLASPFLRSVTTTPDIAIMVSFIRISPVSMNKELAGFAAPTVPYLVAPCRTTISSGDNSAEISTLWKVNAEQASRSTPPPRPVGADMPRGTGRSPSPPERARSARLPRRWRREAAQPPAAPFVWRLLQSEAWPGSPREAQRRRHRGRAAPAPASPQARGSAVRKPRASRSPRAPRASQGRREMPWRIATALRPPSTTSAVSDPYQGQFRRRLYRVPWPAPPRCCARRGVPHRPKTVGARGLRHHLPRAGQSAPATGRSSRPPAATYAAASAPGRNPLKLHVRWTLAAGRSCQDAGGPVGRAATV